MDPHPILHEPWLDRLVAQADPEKRLRFALEAVLALGECQGVAFWMEHEDGHFTLQRELGPASAVPADGVIEAVADGRLSPRTAGLHHMVLGLPPERMVWSLAEPTTSEERLDSVEAFLFVVQTLHPRDEDFDSPSLLPSDF
ncbi:MAG: hypothetical protein H6830_10275 [Planctomycetes bacterium]|nr:hypothetical protein [Planctomycetota bacterium]MCB9909498.1 hypothetical protein [Planctomycetota bacterium]MCB9912535.1 hypothetical protein [Planctomycetota bacterium]HPF15458.1 hypothetical protein [Planctomycetota bacterium]HRV82075.1 hypothetical protein [Planctomycetota bacterium]